MLSQVPLGTIFKDIGRGLFSSINNKVAEAEKIKQELEEEIELDNGYNDMSQTGVK